MAEIRSIFADRKEPQIEERGHGSKGVGHRVTSLKLPEFGAPQTPEQSDPSLVANASDRIGNVVQQGVFPHAGGHGGLKQVLINLLDKAAKFTPESGPIRAAVSMAGRSLEILIRDTRTGIPGNRTADLSLPFSRNENVLSRRHQGSGMGLFITKALVERHGGTMWIESGPGDSRLYQAAAHADQLRAAGLSDSAGGLSLQDA